MATTETRQLAKQVLDLERAVKAIQAAIQTLKSGFTGDDLEFYSEVKQTDRVQRR